jgi:hypothetical protein
VKIAALLGDLNLLNIGFVVKEYNLHDSFVGIDPSCLVGLEKKPIQF